MGISFCPKCGDFSYGYDPAIKLYRCYNANCGIVDENKRYGEGLSENPFKKRDPSGLEISSNPTKKCVH